MLGLNKQILTKNVPARFHEAINRLKNKNKSLVESTELIKKEQEVAKEQLNRLQEIETNQMKIKQNQEKKSSELKEDFARELRAYDNLKELMKQRKEDYKEQLQCKKQEIFKMRVQNNKLKNLIQDTKCDKRVHIIQYEEEIKRLEFQLEEEREKCKLKQICYQTLSERAQPASYSRSIADPPSINLNLTPSINLPTETSPKKGMKRLPSQKRVPKSKRSMNKSSKGLKGSRASSSKLQKEESEICMSQKNEDTYLDVPSPIGRDADQEWKQVKGGGDSSDFSKALSLEESYESSR